MAEDAPRARSRSFAPTVLLGLGGAALAAVAAARDWATASGRGLGAAVTASTRGSESAPLAVALALVALAAWGTVLVLRGRLRRLVAVVGALATAGVLVSALTSAGRARSDAVAAAVGKGAASGGASGSLTGWYVACVVAAALCLGCFVVAVLVAPSWPAMGSRYDAPTGRAERPATEQDLWRALDDGRDPTA